MGLTMEQLAANGKTTLLLHVVAGQESNVCLAGHCRALTWVRARVRRSVADHGAGGHRSARLPRAAAGCQHRGADLRQVPGELTRGAHDGACSRPWPVTHVSMLQRQVLMPKSLGLRKKIPWHVQLGAATRPPPWRQLAGWSMPGLQPPAHSGMMSQEMLLEARGKHEDAAKLIQKHLEEAPDCQMLLKRQARPDTRLGPSVVLQ